MDGDGAVPPRRWVTAWKWLRPLLGLALLAGVLALAWDELRALDWAQIHGEIIQSDWRLLALSLIAVGANVAAMGLYDAVCLPGGPRLRFGTRWGVGAVCFAWTNFLTIGPIGGPALRMLVYTRRGLSAGQVARGLAVQYLGFGAALPAWLIAMWAPLPEGGAWLAARVALAAALSVALSVAARGALARALGHSSVMASTVRTLREARAVRIGLIGFMDWGLSLASFWLIAAGAGVRLDPFTTARAFFGGHIVGMASMLPGGLGSADATWLIVLTNGGSAPDEAAAVILLFRLLFYILPWAAAVLVTIALASRSRSEIPWRGPAVAAAQVVGSLFVVLSAATPSLRAEIVERESSVPLAVVETAHLVAVVSATALAVLGMGLARRSSRAFVWSAALLAACLTAHLLRGGDAQESIVCGLMLGLLLVARGEFVQRGVSALPRVGVAAAMVGVALALYFGVGLTAAMHVRWDPELLTRFAHRSEFPRFMRGGLAQVLTSAVVLALAAIGRRAERRGERE